MRQGDGCRPPLNSAICGGGGGASLLNCHLDSLQLKFPPFSNSPFFFFFGGNIFQFFSNFSREKRGVVKSCQNFHIIRLCKNNEYNLFILLDGKYGTKGEVEEAQFEETLYFKDYSCL